MAIVGSAYVNIDIITDKIESKLERAFDKLKDMTINVSADTSSAMKKIEEVVDTIEAVDTEINVKVNSDEIDETIRRIEDDSDPHIQVHADTARARDALDDLVEDFDGQEVTITADPMTAWASARFAWLSRARVVEFVAKVNKKAFAQVAASLASLSGGQYVLDRLESISEYLLDIGTHAPKISLVSTAIAGITGAVSAALSNLLVLGGSLASIAGAALVLPGIFAGMGIGLGTMIVALRDANNHIGDLKQGFTDAATIIKANFWEPAAQPIREFVNGIMPQFQASIGEVATALGGFTAATANAFSKWLTAPILKYMMDNLRESIDVASTAMDPFIESIMTLGAVGSEYLPRLAEWFVRISNNFNDWLQGADSDGRLRQWIETGIDALYDLGRVIKETSNIFYGLYQAAEAAGGATLETLANALGRISDIVNTPAFQNTLIQVFRGGHAAMDGMLSALGPLGNALQVLGPSIEESLGLAGRAIGGLVEAFSAMAGQNQFGDGLTAMFQGIYIGVQQLMPAMEPLGKMMGSLGEVIGELARNFGPLLAAVITALAPPMETLFDAVQPLIPVLGDALIGIVEALGPGLQGFADAIASSLPGLGSFVTVLADIVAAIVDGLGPALPGIVLGVMGFVTAFKGISAAAAGGIYGAKKAIDGVRAAVNTGRDALGGFKKAASAIGGAASSGFSAVSSAAGTAAAAIGRTTAAQKIASAATVAWTGIQKAFNLVMSMNPIGLIITAIGLLIAGVVLAYNKIGWFRDLVDGAFAGIQVAIGAVVDFWNNTLVPIFQAGLDAAGEFFNGLGEFFGGIGSAISGAFNGVVDWISNVFSEISAAISSFMEPIITVWSEGWNRITEVFRKVWDGLVAIFEPIINLIVTVITSYIEILVAIWTAIWEIVKTVFQGVWKVMSEFVAGAIENIRNVIITVVTAISDWWTTTWQTIVDFFSMVWNNIVAFFTPIIQSIHDTIVTIVSAVVTWWNTTWQSIVDNFTIIWNLLVAIFTPIIQSIQTTITTVVTAIQSVWNSVWSSVSSFFTTIWNAIVSVVTAVINRIQATISAVLSTIQAVWNSIWSSISSTVSSIWSGIVSAVAGFVNSVRDKVTDVLNKMGAIGSDILAKISNFPSLLISSGTDLINGLISGIQSGKEAVINKIQEIASGALDAIKNFFGIKSPSRVMRDQVGAQIGAGLAIGIEKSIGRVKSATEKLQEAAMVEVQDIKLPKIIPASSNAVIPARVPSSLSSDTQTASSTGTAVGTAGGRDITVIVNPSQGLSETQIGESVSTSLIWQLNNR